MKKAISLTISWALIFPNLCLATGSLGKAGAVGATSGAPEFFGPVFPEQAQDLLAVLRPAAAQTAPTLSAFLSHIDLQDKGQRALLGPFKEALLLEEVEHKQADPNKVIQRGLELLNEKAGSLQEAANNPTATPFQLSIALKGMEALAPFLQAFQPEIAGSWQTQQQQVRSRLNSLLDNNMLAREMGSAEALDDSRRGEDAPDMDDAPVRPAGVISGDLRASVAEPFNRMLDHTAQALVEVLKNPNDLSQKERAAAMLADLAIKSQDPGLLRLAMETLSAEQQKASDIGYQDDIDLALNDIFDSIGEGNRELSQLKQELHEHINLGHIRRAMKIAESKAPGDVRHAAADIALAAEYSLSGPVRLFALESLRRLKASTPDAQVQEFIQGAIDGLFPPGQETQAAPEKETLGQALERQSAQLAQTLSSAKPSDMLAALLYRFEQRMYLHTGRALAEQLPGTQDLTERYRLLHMLIHVGQRTEYPELLRLIVNALVAEKEKTAELEYRRRIDSALHGIFASPDSHMQREIRQNFQDEIDRGQIQALTAEAAQTGDSPVSRYDVEHIAEIGYRSGKDIRSMAIASLQMLRDSAKDRAYHLFIQDHIDELHELNARYAALGGVSEDVSDPKAVAVSAWRRAAKALSAIIRKYSLL